MQYGLAPTSLPNSYRAPPMKKKQLQPQDDINKDLQIIKAAAQAWHSHSGTSRSTNEFDAYPRRHFKARPSRFKLEAMSNPSVKLKDERTSIANTPHWDFAQSLWDSYELVTLAKKLETALVLDDPFSAAGSELEGNSSRAQKRGKESKNSLRNLLKRVSSRRFVEADIKIPRDDNNGF